MKYIKNIGFGLMILAGVSVTTTSCKDFLDEELTTSLSTDYFDTEQGLIDLTESLYGNIRWHFGYEWAYAITLYGTDEFTNGNDLTSEPWNTYDNRFGPIACTPATGAANNNCLPQAQPIITAQHRKRCGTKCIMVLHLAIPSSPRLKMLFKT